MIWLLLAALSTGVWSISNVLDSILIRAKHEHPFTIVSIIGFFGSLPAIGLFLAGVHLPSYWPSMFGIAGGAIGVFAFYPYYKTLETTHAANAVFLWNASLVFTPFLAYFFLNEQLQITQYLAIILLTLGAVFLTYPKRGTPKMSWRIIGLMMFASILTSFEGIFLKRAFTEANGLQGILLDSIGNFISFSSIVLTSRPVRTELRNFIRDRSVRIVGVNELLDMAGNMFRDLALSLGPVSLVTAFGGFQPLLIIILGLPIVLFLRIRKTQQIQPPSLTRLLPAIACSILALMLL